MHSSDTRQDARRGTGNTVRTTASRVATAAAAAVLVALVILAGCSSAPSVPEETLTRRNQAARFAEAGNGQFNQGNYPLALRYFTMALNENTAIDFLPGIARSHNSLGRVYAAAGQPRDAEDNYRTALAVARLAEDGEQEMQSLVNLGVLALSAGLIDDAIQYFDSAQRVITEERAEESAILLHGRGTILARQQQFAEARELFEEAQRINRDRSNWVELASNYYMLASLASRQQQFDDAYTLANRALEFDRRAEHSPGIAADLLALGIISQRRGDDQQADRKSVV